VRNFICSKKSENPFTGSWKSMEPNWEQEVINLICSELFQEMGKYKREEPTSSRKSLHIGDERQFIQFYCKWHPLRLNLKNKIYMDSWSNDKTCQKPHNPDLYLKWSVSQWWMTPSRFICSGFSGSVKRWINVWIGKLVICCCTILGWIQNWI